MTINTVSIVFFVIAAVSLLVAIYAFIRFNIPQVIGELSGRTAKKSIAQMRDKNVKTGNKAHRPSPAAVERGTLTDKIDDKPKASKSEKKAEKKTAQSIDPNATVRLESSPYDEDATMPLEVDDNATAPLDNQAGSEPTDVLSEGTVLLDVNETTVLSDVAFQPSVSQNAKIDGFEVIKSIVLIHTNETI